jgi:hypothetical protein
MDLKESAINLKYIKELISFLEELKEMATNFKIDETNHNSSLEKKYLKKVWELQANTARKEIEEALKLKRKNTPNTTKVFEKFLSIFKEKHPKEITDLDKFNDFYNSLDDTNLHSEKKIELESIKLEFVSLQFYNPKFSDKAEELILDHTKYPGYAKKFHLSVTDRETLNQLALKYLEESKNFILKNHQKDFEAHTTKVLNIFNSKYGSLKKNSMFDLYDYDAEHLSKKIRLDYLDSINEEIKEKKVLYKFCLEKYKKTLDNCHPLNFSILSGFDAKNTNEILKGLNQYTLMFEEYHAFDLVKYSFSYYPEGHEALKELILEMKKQNLIPNHIEKNIMEGDKEFNEFFKKVVEKHNLHEELIQDLPKNTPIQKKKVMKV